MNLSRVACGAISPPGSLAALGSMRAHSPISPRHNPGAVDFKVASGQDQDTTAYRNLEAGRERGAPSGESRPARRTSGWNIVELTGVGWVVHIAGLRRGG